jgi:GAF domain-containing protein
LAKKNASIQVLQEPLNNKETSSQVDQSLAIFDVLSQVGVASPQIEVMAKILVDQLKTILSLKNVTLFLQEGISDGLTLLLSSSKKTSIKKSHSDFTLPPVVITVAATGKPQTEEGSTAIPLLLDHHSLGVLLAIPLQGKPITENALANLQLVCAHAAIWFAKAQEMTKTRQSLEQLRSAHHISSVIQGSNPDETIGKAVQILQELHSESKIAFLSAESKGNLRVKAYAGLTSHDTTTLRLKTGFGLAGLSAQKRKAMIQHDASELSDSQGLLPDSRSIMAAPVMFGGNLVGILNVENSQPNKFDDLDLEVLTVLADNIGAVLTNLSLLNQVRDQVEQQRKLFEITDKLRSSSDRSTIMNASVVELSKALNMRKVTLTLTSPSTEIFSSEEVLS